MKKAPDHIARTVEQIVASTPIDDIHTHLYDPAFRGLLLWGIDELLVYHYLVAESFRFLSLPYEKFWQLPQSERAELIWNELFLKHSPISEACRGVLTTLNRLGLDVRQRDLAAIRAWFRDWSVEDYTTRCIELAGLKSICMTNSPFDDLERPLWESGFSRDPRFKAALRIDPLLVSWESTAPRLLAWGYEVKPELDAKSFSEVRR
ncbi:MAG TPA: glucuronate isomerase, partial [Verrucomicrobiae bacterium]|nr:glucuronate isomerase [Verrucomicrobiae bacterium]